ncbi:MAG: hypothetical protein WCW16_02100 [Candidatus Magasanikbacteria bacterium]
MKIFAYILTTLSFFSGYATFVLAQAPPDVATSTTEAQVTTTTVEASDAYGLDDLLGIRSIDEFINLGSADLRTIVIRLINIALGFLGILLVLLIIYSGLLWMTSGGDEERTKKARRVLFNAIIGLIIILLSNSMVIFLLRSLGQATGSSPVEL